MENKSGYIDDSILEKAIEKWGREAQTEMIKEECLELALALQKLNRIRGDYNSKFYAVIDEIADVKIMIKQAEKLFQPDLINERVDYKMARLEGRINNNEES